MPQTAPPAKPAPIPRRCEGPRGDQLDLGRAVDVDELDQEKVDVVGFKLMDELVEFGFLLGHAGLVLSFGRSPAIRNAADPKR